jgi:hypothetical protein
MPDPNKETEASETEELEKTETEKEEKGKESDEEPKKEPEKPEKPDDEDEEPPVRRSSKDFIIARKDRKIKKLEGERKEEEEEEKEDEGEDKDEEFTPEGKKLIQKRIEKAIRPVLDQVRGQSDEQELRDVLKKYGDPAEKLKKKIEKYMNHPAYQNVPVEFIFLGLASAEIRKAEKKKTADEEAEKDKTGGFQKRPAKIAKIPDVREMSDDQIGDLVHKVLSGQF